MAVTVTDRGSGTHNTGATSFTLSPASNFAAGAIAVLCITADNSASAGSSNDINSVTDGLGNTWTKRASPLYDNGAASAGIQGAIFTTSQNGGTIQTSTVITVNFGSSPTAKGWSILEVAPGGGNSVAYANAGVNTGATTGTPTVTTDSVPVGDAVIGIYHSENVNATTGDSDTTNGSWSTQVTVTVGAGTSGIRHSSQYKVQTTTASTQTFNPTATSQDCILSWVRIHEVVNTTVTPGVASLTTTRYAPSVIKGTILVPGKASLVTTLFTPVVSKTNNVRVTPGTAALVLTRFAPSVIKGTVVVPGTASLVTVRYAPSVIKGTRIIPGTASLVLTRYAPSVAVGSGHVDTLVTPGTASLILTRYAPTVLVRESDDIEFLLLIMAMAYSQQAVKKRPRSRVN